MARGTATDDSKIFVWCRLTPELSRTARGGPVESETAKRSRLERIVRPLNCVALCQIGHAMRLP